MERSSPRQRRPVQAELQQHPRVGDPRISPPADGASPAAIEKRTRRPFQKVMRRPDVPVKREILDRESPERRSRHNGGGGQPPAPGNGSRHNEPNCHPRSPRRIHEMAIAGSQATPRGKETPIDRHCGIHAEGNQCAKRASEEKEDRCLGSARYLSCAKRTIQ
jgi:hypothetical protein